MINREWQTATVTTLSGAVTDTDSYGQPTLVKTADTPPVVASRSIQIYKKTFSQMNIDAPSYLDIDEVALTKDRNVTTKDRLTVDGVDYRVKYVVNAPRFTQLLLARLTS